MDKFTVLDLLQLDLKEHDALNLKCIAGRPGLVREITVPELNRPGLALSGFLDNFAEQRLQIFGRGENAFLAKLEKDRRLDTIQKMIPSGLFDPVKSDLFPFQIGNPRSWRINRRQNNFTARI